MVWTNNDGLRVLMGIEEANEAKGGEIASPGNEHRVVEIKIPAMTALGTNPTQLDDFVQVPKGARIEQVEVITDTAATSGGAAVLNVGLYALDNSTPIDADGLVAALALASINATGEKVTLNVGSTSAGALIGTTLAAAGLLYADYDTAAYTAGAVRVRIKFYIP